MLLVIVWIQELFHLQVLPQASKLQRGFGGKMRVPDNEPEEE